MKQNRYFIFTLGCQMNVSDSERLAQKIEEIGYKSAPEKAADLVIANACSVRQKAVDRIWGKIKNWQEQHKRILITGCVLKSDRRKLEEKNVEFFHINDLAKLSNILKLHYDNIANIETTIDIKKKKSKIAYIPIMTGCDNFCSYCAVPYTRGREISRPMNEIIDDVKRVLDDGAKNILLLGQNVNSYKRKLAVCHSEQSEESPTNVGSHIRERSFTNVQDDEINNQDFIKLLKTVDNISSDFKFNFLSSNPHDFSDELISVLATLKKWPRELHLPLQSGDDEILKKMNRKYTSGQYLTLISNIKNQISNINITTDIIVGFPGETKQQFQNTVKICQKVSFSKAYIAQYSPRPGTAAEKLKDDVSASEKKRRWQVLEDLINSTN